jgi:hypothetical protein
MHIAKGPARGRPYFGVLELELAALLEDWDPIGVYHGTRGRPANPSRRQFWQHEYDDLVRPTIALLVAEAGSETVARELAQVLTEGYGMTLDGIDIPDFAHRVLGWWGSR